MTPFVPGSGHRPHVKESPGAVRQHCRLVGRRRAGWPMSALLMIALLLAAVVQVPAGAQQTMPPRAIDLPVAVRSTHWYLRDRHTTGVATRDFAYGPGGTPVTGDWDGNGSMTAGWFDRGVWYLRNSNTAGSPDLVLRYGQAGDVPVVGDWTHGDQVVTDRLGVVRPGPRGLEWLLELDLSAADTTASDGRANLSFHFGSPGDVPLAGRWQQDPCVQCPPGDFPGVLRHVLGRGLTWYLETDLFTPPRGDTTTPGAIPPADIVLRFGSRGDHPLVGDWNGDLIDNPAVVRRNRWLLDDDTTVGDSGRPRVASDGRHDIEFQFGREGDRFSTYR